MHPEAIQTGKHSHVRGLSRHLGGHADMNVPMTAVKGTCKLLRAAHAPARADPLETVNARY
jgi:hypothetical protein